MKKNNNIKKNNKQKSLDYRIIQNFEEFTHEITKSVMHMWAASKPLKDAIRFAIKAKFITQDDANMMLKMYNRRSDELTAFMIALKKPLFSEYQIKVESKGDK